MKTRKLEVYCKELFLFLFYFFITDFDLSSFVVTYDKYLINNINFFKYMKIQNT